MDIRISPSNLNGCVQAVSSKSDVHRALICAAFADAPTEISCNLLSKDIEATVRCLSAAGAQIRADIDREKGSGSIKVVPVRGHLDNSGNDFKKDNLTKEDFKKSEREESEKIPELFCGESGSTLRFLTPVMAALGKTVLFTGEGELPNRPMDALLSVLQTHGCHTDGGSAARTYLPLRISGKLHGGIFELPGNVSSQYITGLLLAFPLLGERAEIRLTTPLQSASYVDMTLDTMSRFGIAVQKTEQGFRLLKTEQPEYLEAEQSEHGKDEFLPYHSPGQYRSDGDWSNAAFWLCADRMNGNSIAVDGLRMESLQGDRAICDLLPIFRKQHCADDQGNFSYQFGCCSAHQGQLRIIDASNIPDLVPALAALAAVIPGTTKIIRAERLRMKECDRLSALSDVLGKMGAQIEEHTDGLTIEGVEDAGLPGGCEVSGHNDHRIVMAAAIAASACRDSVVIKGAQAVQKSYPHFFSDFKKLGGKADVVDLR